jgi:hypothetical protein
MVDVICEELWHPVGDDRCGEFYCWVRRGKGWGLRVDNPANRWKGSLKLNFLMIFVFPTVFLKLPGAFCPLLSETPQRRAKTGRGGDGTYLTRLYSDNAPLRVLRRPLDGRRASHCPLDGPQEGPPGGVWQ